MDYEYLVVACKRCGMKFPVNQMKMDRINSNLICAKCYNQVFDASGEVIVQAAESDRMTLGCSSCGYTFARNKSSSLSEVCPYCGKSTVKGMIAAKSAEKKLTDY